MFVGEAVTLHRQPTSNYKIVLLAELRVEAVKIQLGACGTAHVFFGFMSWLPSSRPAVNKHSLEKRVEAITYFPKMACLILGSIRVGRTFPLRGFLRIFRGYRRRNV